MRYEFLHPVAMPKLLFCCLILASTPCPLQSLPIGVPQLSEATMDFGDLKSWDEPHFLQNPSVFLDQRREGNTEDIFSKDGFNLNTYSMDDSIKEDLFDNPPRISLLGRLQSKERKQYKKRSGNLSECFWKYCV